MFDYDSDSNRYVAMHHPFTAPQSEDIEEIESEPASLKSRGYDLVVNGYEIAGKTGTAEQAIDGQYSKTKINTFASVFPSSKATVYFVQCLMSGLISFFLLI